MADLPGEELPARLQRAMAVEMLSRSFAHEFNNILGCILGPAQLLAASTQDPQIHQRLSLITQSVQRGIALTSRLSALGTDPGGMRTIDVHACLGRMIESGGCGAAELQADATLARILGDEVLIGHALGILVRTLAGPQGRVVIATSNFPSASPRLTETFGRPDAWIRLLLVGTDRSISARQRELVADPLSASNADPDSLAFGGAVAALRHSRGRILAEDGQPPRLQVFLPTTDG